MTADKWAAMTEPTIYSALASVMADVDHVAKRERNNSPSGSYNFRGIDAVVNAVGPVLRKQRVIVVPDVREYHYGEILAGKDRKPMGHARVVVAYTFYGPAGDSIVCSAAGEAFDSGDKATPKAMSVAFRTALLQALALPTDEPDPDSQTYERAAEPPPPESPRDRAGRLAKAKWPNADMAERRQLVEDQMGTTVAAATDAQWAELADWLEGKA